MIPETLALREERFLTGVGRCRLFRDAHPLFENAIEKGSCVHVVAELPRRLGTVALTCLFVDDREERARLPMRYRGIRNGFDAYECTFCPEEAGLLFYSFVGESPNGKFFGMRASAAGELVFSRRANGAHFQLTVTDFRYPAPRWLLGSIIYHIFVDRFCRMGTPPVREGAVFHKTWRDGIPYVPQKKGEAVLNNDFFGGTLDGITSKLPELARLGVGCLYLSPIFEAYSNHRYDTACYEHVDPMLGGDTALVRLLDAARHYGMRVVLDGVFNHTGSDSVYFNKMGRYRSLGAYQSRESPYYAWYSFSQHPDSYTCWWGIDTLPRLSPETPSLREYLVGKEGIVARYAALGIGGFRLDVVDELPDDFVRDIKARLASENPDAVLFGEVWEDASCKVAYGVRRSYYTGSELDGVMNYPLRTGLLTYFRTGETSPLSYALCEVLPNMPRRIAATTMNLLGTHDTVRAITALVGEEMGNRPLSELAKVRLSEGAYKRGRRLLLLSYLALSVLPGIPTIYYGDEVGMEGYADPLNRGPYPWHRRDRCLLEEYQKIGRMRRKEETLAQGGFRLLLLTPEVFAFLRYRGARRVVSILNRSDHGLSVRFEHDVTPLYGAGRRASRFLLAPESGAVFRTVAGNRLRLCGDSGECVLFPE